jgi:transposase, IS30 family
MSYKHLTENERYVISHLKSAKFPVREIARRIGRHHTSVMREIRRNGPRYSGDVYWYYFIQPEVNKRRHEARVYRRQAYAPLTKYVEEKLQLDWPPETIAARLRIEFPDDPRMRACHETIYRWIYLDAGQGGNLHQHLRRQRKYRRRQKRYGSGRRYLPGRISIHDRPAVVATRERFGDWEGDTLEGAKGCGHLATHVERKSRYLLAAKLSDKKAETMMQASAKAFWRMPRTIRHTLTLDNGKEFSRFKELEAKTGLSVYFADAYAAWQRGTNENTNGLLRHYFPKGFDFRTVSDEDLDQIVKRVNNRPRKCLSYRSPAEVLREALRGALLE